LQHVLNIPLLGWACLETEIGSEAAMILNLLKLQKIIDRFFDDKWVTLWLLDDL
jgi:hypothetical protein